MEKIWEKIFPCFVAMNEKKLLERKNLQIVKKLANTHHLFKLLFTYLKNLVEFYR